MFSTALIIACRSEVCNIRGPPRTFVSANSSVALAAMSLAKFQAETNFAMLALASAEAAGSKAKSFLAAALISAAVSPMAAKIFQDV